jgi:hypothetical protein
MCYNNYEKNKEDYPKFVGCLPYCIDHKRCGWDCWLLTLMNQEGEKSKE